MPAPYSYDLRQKAIAAVKRGERKKDVSEIFNISRNTRLPVAQTVRTERRLSSHHALSAFFVDRRSRTGRSFGSLFNSMAVRLKPNSRALWGDNVSQQNISDALQKIGVSLKKRLTATLERDDLKRQDFQERLKSKSASQIVYVDEARIDNHS